MKGAACTPWILLAWMSSLAGLALAGSLWNDPQKHYIGKLNIGPRKVVYPLVDRVSDRSHL